MLPPRSNFLVDLFAVHIHSVMYTNDGDVVVKSRIRFLLAALVILLPECLTAWGLDRRRLVPCMPMPLPVKLQLFNTSIRKKYRCQSSMAKMR